jgi:hypothetical protein
MAYRGEGREPGSGRGIQRGIVDGKAVHKIIGIGNGLFLHAFGQAQKVSRRKFIVLAVNGIAGFTFNNIGYLVIFQKMGIQMPIRAAFAKNLINDSGHKIVNGFFFYQCSPHQ